jgi:hypothetical protein
MELITTCFGHPILLDEKILEGRFLIEYYTDEELLSGENSLEYISDQ